MTWTNCFPCFNPTETDDDTNTNTNTGPSTTRTGPSTPRSPRAGPSSSLAPAPSTSTGPSTPRSPRAGPSSSHAAGPSTSTASPSSSRGAERGRIGSWGKKNRSPSGYDLLALDKEKSNLNLNIEVMGSSSQSQNIQDLPSFGLKELRVATNDFKSECLGEGGFGKVYKGYLRKKKQEVAIKQLKPNKGAQGIRQFVMEVEVLRKVDHPNLLKLLGFCAQSDQRLLVYEYMTLGSLNTHLFDLPPGRQPLNWETRIKIAIDIASGLEYLHDRMNPSIIHRDLKSCNILLGDGYHAKLSDFGTARIGPTGNDTHVSTEIMGSYAYIAPEYHLTGRLTRMSDIYGFGVVLLELISGKVAYDPRKPEGQRKLTVWVKRVYDTKDRDRYPEVADPILAGQYTLDSLKRALTVAIRCTNEEAKKRPNIARVVQDLKNVFPTATSRRTPASPRN